MNQVLNEEFDWQRCPEVGRLIARRVDHVVGDIPFASRLRKCMLDATGTRLIDWVDHLCLPVTDSLSRMVEEMGYVRAARDVEEEVWRHPAALVPTIRIREQATADVCLKVDSVTDFLQAHQLDDVAVMGHLDSIVKSAIVAQADNCRLAVIERHGTSGFQGEAISEATRNSLVEHAAAFLNRERIFSDGNSVFNEFAGFEQAHRLIEAAVDDLGVNRACDLFFESERCYWESRNQAARMQKKRQDQLGLGWANHDHHTYRSSREVFSRLVGLLESLGFTCRERFYGGADAGWGAQVLEQAHAGIVVFADVDLSPDEVAGDFAHEGLAARDELGTVGLWCKLHGEAIMAAGMHHLECQFDFDAARAQLADAGIETMKPFTDFEYLKQAFTVGEVWEIDPGRIELLRKTGQINNEQCNRFLDHGSVGSHLEILQRDDGYKGFNQTGISEIILATDPRHRGAV